MPITASSRLERNQACYTYTCQTLNRELAPTMPTVQDINDEYFGKDKSRNYLKHDFTAVLRGVVQRSVLIEVLRECSKARHNEEVRKDKDGNESIAFGDFDPDNAGFLWSIYESYQKGVMVDVRQLLTPKEAGTGGKFINDLAKLNVDAFTDYYKTDQAYTIPPLLRKQYFKSRKLDKELLITNFIDEHRDEIEDAVDSLMEKVIRFQTKGYFHQIMTEYQGLKFHKDQYPEKYDVTEELEEFGVFKTNKITRRDKASVKITEIAKCLNEFAEIVTLYQNLVSQNTSFLGTNWPLETYIERSFALFAKDVSMTIQEKTIRDVVKYLDSALRVTDWDYRRPD